MIGLLKRTSVATPAEQLENDKLVKEIIGRRDPVKLGKEHRVCLDRDNPLSQEEYPDRWVGMELDRDANYVLLRFPKAFAGKNEKGHKATKTFKTGMHRHTLWVPKWLLKDFAKENKV